MKLTTILVAPVLCLALATAGLAAEHAVMVGPCHVRAAFADGVAGAAAGEGSTTVFQVALIVGRGQGGHQLGLFRFGQGAGWRGRRVRPRRRGVRAAKPRQSDFSSAFSISAEIFAISTPMSLILY